MSSYASRQPPPVNPAGPAAPAKPLENPLEEFASVLGVDVSALQHLGGSEDVAPTLGAAREPDFARSAPALPSPRRRRALTLGIFLVLGVAGGVGAWTLRSASGSPGLSAMEADAPPKAQPRAQETAALHDDAASAPHADWTSAPAPADLASTEKPPSAPGQQSEPPPTTPSAAPAPTAMESAPSAALAAALASAAAAPPVTRSIALQASAAEPAQVPTPLVAAPAASPEPNRPKAASVRTDASPLPSGDGAPARAKNPAPVSAPRTSAAPGDSAPAPLKAPMPAPRASASASAAGAPKPAPVKEKLDPPAALHVDSGRDQAVARSDAAAPAAPPAAPAAADPGSGGGTADSVLRFVPNLYDKAANALRGSPTTQVAAADAAPPPTTPSAAAAPNGGGFSADSVLQFVPNLYEKAASALRGSPTQVAKADPKPAAAGAAGGYGVQFAAPESEPAARKESARLRSKFASELGGLQPSVRQAEAHGRKIYQVRIGGMSKADAAALCFKLKSSGEAACSVARD